MPGLIPPREKLKKLLRDLNGYNWPAAWWDESRPINTQGWIELTEISMVPIGVDVLVREYDPTTQTQAMTVAGVRTWVVQMKAYSYTPAIKAIDVLEKTKMRLGKPYAYYQYEQWGLSMIDWGTTIPLPNIVDGHVFTMASCDMKWGWRITDTDLTTTTEGFIDEVQGDGTLEPGPIDIPIDIKGD